VTARRVLALATVGVLVLVLGGCGSIKERKENADRIIDSVDAATAAKSARMAVAVDVDIRLDGAEGKLAGASGLAGDRPVVTAVATADLRQGRVAYVATGADGASEATRIDAGTTIYARRPAQTATNAPQRPWVRVDLIGIDPDDIHNEEVELADAARRPGQSAGFDNPLFLLTLLRGALSGSVEEVGQEVVGSVPTTHFKLNIDREKAVRDDDEDVQDAYEVIFKSIFATATVLPAEVWLDAQGLPRRYALTLKSKLRRRPIADIKLMVELLDVGQPVDIALPDKRETVRVEGLGGLVQALTGGDQ
jgi:hypothetical protein